MSAKVIVPIVAVVCAAGGFFAGRATAPEAGDGVLGTGSVATESAASVAGSGGGGEEVTQPLPSLPAESPSASSQPTRETLALRKRVQELEAELASRPEPSAAPVINDAKPPTAEETAAAVAKLREALASGDANLVAKLGEARAIRAAPQRAASELLKLLERSDSIFGKAQLARLLGQLGDTQALPALQQLLETEDDDTVRTAVVGALGNIPDASSVELLTKEFARESESPMPPSLAATSLGKIGTDEAVASLKAEIEKGTNGMVRAFAVRALAERKDPKLAEFFLAQVRRDDVNDRFRKQAIGAIVETGNKDARWELEKIAFDAKASKGVQEAAKRAVNTLAGEKVYEVD